MGLACCIASFTSSSSPSMSWLRPNHGERVKVAHSPIPACPWQASGRHESCAPPSRCASRISSRARCSSLGWGRGWRCTSSCTRSPLWPSPSGRVPSRSHSCRPVEESGWHLVRRPLARKHCWPRLTPATRGSNRESRHRRNGRSHCVASRGRCWGRDL